MSVRGGADQADTTKPEISTDPQTSGPYNTEEMPITKIATGAAGTSTLVGSGNPFPVIIDATQLAALAAALESVTAVISGAIALDAPTLAALETIQVGNFPATQPVSAAALPLPAGAATEATLAALAALLETIELGATTLAALETIGLDAATLAALETISVGNFPADFPDAATLAKLEAIRVLLAATLTIAGNVATGAVDSGNAVKTGGRASNAPTAVDFGDRVDHWVTAEGAQVIAGTLVTGTDGSDNSVLMAVPNVYNSVAANPLLVANKLFNGATWDRGRTPNVFKTRADASITAGTPAAAWTPTSGKKFRVMGLSLSLSVAGQIILKDGSTEVLRSPQLAAGGVWNPTDLGNGKLSAAANNVLNLDPSATGNVGGSIWGHEE